MVLGLYSVLWGKGKESSVSSEFSIEDGKTRTEAKEATGDHSDAVPVPQ